MNLYKIIKQNQKLAEKRNPAFDTNRFAKFLMYFMVVYWAALFLFLGVMLPFMFEGIVPNMEPYHIMNQGFIYVMLADFLMRFIGQPSVSQEIKPYLLMPVKRKKLNGLPSMKPSPKSMVNRLIGRPSNKNSAAPNKPKTAAGRSNQRVFSPNKSLQSR